MTDSPPVPPWKRVLPRKARIAGTVMGTLVGIELVLGVGTLLAVPFHRHDSFAPEHGRPVYLAHAVLGALLGAAAVAIVPHARRLTRSTWVGAVTGLAGIGVGGVGGLLAAAQATRLLGMALMLLGSVAAEVGYLMPLVDTVPPPGPG